MNLIFQIKMVLLYVAPTLETGYSGTEVTIGSTLIMNQKVRKKMRVL